MMGLSSRQLSVASSQWAAGARHRAVTRALPSLAGHNHQLATNYYLPSTARPGISLVEVLFAMGILSVGILSLVALIPLGAYELAESAKMDQSSTLGRASFRDLEVRAFLRPKLWVDTQLGCVVDPTVPNGQRLVAYPYLPKNVWTMYGSPGVLQPAPAPQAPLNIPDPSAGQGKMLWPQPWNSTSPLGVPVPYTLRTTAPLYPPLMPLTLPPPYYPQFAATDSPLLVLDPLMVSTVAQRELGTAAVPPYPGTTNWTSVQSFPYQPTYQAEAPLIPRLTLLSWPLPLFQPAGLGGMSAAAQPPIWPTLPLTNLMSQPRIMPLPLADRIFRSSDDLLYNAPDRDHDRPTASLAGGTSQQSQGSFSWFVTIAPNSSETDQAASNLNDPLTDASANLAMVSALSSAKHFNVSVVVCQNRNLDVPATLTSGSTPGEWMVPATVNGAGFGGGEVTLYAYDTTNHTADANRLGWLSTLHAGQWLMLSGINISAEIRYDTASSANKYWPKFRTVANWYRIVAVDDGSGLAATSPITPYRNVTLNGPDWPQGIQWDNSRVNQTSSVGPPPVSFSAIGNPPPGVAYGPQYAQLTSAVATDSRPVNIYTFATIVDGVVGVYQKSITLDGDSPFAPP